MEITAAEIQVGMTVRYDGHYCGPQVFEVLEVGRGRRCDIMLQTTKGPMAFDSSDRVVWVD